MKRTLFQLVIKTLIVIILVGNLTGVDVFAYDKEREDGNKVEQTRTQTPTDDRGVVFNKIKASSEVAKSISTKNDNIGNSLVSVKKRKDYVEGEILVKYKNSRINLQTVSGRASALNFIRTKSLEKREDLRKNNISVLRIKDAKTVEQKIAELKNDPNVEYAQPNFQYYPIGINTDDTDRGLLWGLDNTGQTVGGTYAANNPGSTDKDIDAPEAWAINEGGNSSILVAVIDSGVAYNHPDLVASMWDGINCKDENGVVIVGGCNHGYDYEDSDNIPLPTTSSHGTHIAGTIAAVKNNTKGIIGVAPQAKIMAVKSSLTTSNAVKSINFAKQNGAKIINASWGSYQPDSTYFDLALYTAIKDFSGIFVAAAGNCGFNREDGGVDDGTHSNPQCTGKSHINYPQYFVKDSSLGAALSNIIVVAATDQNDALATFSDYGATSVDVGAPGTNILSTVADTNVVDETFQSVTPPAVPSGWIKGGANNKWATYDFSGNKVLYGQVPSFPYDNNANTTITSPNYDLGGNTSGATMDFWTRCDTEYTGFTTQIFYDYMALEYSSDGVNFSAILNWDEPYLDYLNGDSNPAGGAVFNFSRSIPSQYLISNFKFRLRWITDSSLNNYDGCSVNDVKITKYSDGSDEQYGYKNGTSMATPHVAGLAALIEGYNPSLTLTQVKNAILNTGDSVASLSGKTVSGKRINAQNALQSVNPAKAITTFDFTTPAVTGVVGETAHTIELTVPFGTDVTSLVPTIAITGASVSPLSGVAQNFTSPITYTVTAADSSTQAYVVTVTIAPATTHTISGTIKYYDEVKVVPGASVILEDGDGMQIATTTTDASGVYQFTGVAHAGDYVVRISKSDNASGLTSADRIKIGRHIVGLELFDTIYKTIAGDVNNSGGLTSADRIKIGRFIVGLDANLPSGAWKFYPANAVLNVTNYLTFSQTRTYINITVDMPSQDFVGVKMGDVNNSWNNS